MKRKIASRKLQRKCIRCNKRFLKTEVYYLKRVVYEECDRIHAYEYLSCPRCKYYDDKKRERFKRFVESKKCQHPKTDEIWVVMEGEDYAMEPSHEKCRICEEEVF